MKSYEASSTINASPQVIWAILTDAPRYPEWDAGVQRVEGSIAPGEKIKVTSEANPGRAFPVKVTEFSPDQKMTWSGGMPGGLFKGVRTFTLSPQGNGTTRFTVREEYTGPLLPLIWRTMPDLGPSFEQFATGLKKQAESRSPG
ncbi:MAG TPA: SRPBCC domain-containing protein [Actinomycetota bacterium]|nr:SRPBCC domain-containing protein [Actinomycetota bacterium]